MNAKSFEYWSKKWAANEAKAAENLAKPELFSSAIAQQCDRAELELLHELAASFAVFDPDGDGIRAKNKWLTDCLHTTIRAAQIVAPGAAPDKKS